MELSRKSFEVKAAPEEGEGVFKGYASTWDRDLYDDEIVKGAYAECLKADFKGTGEGIPIYWNHDYSTPMNLIGQSISAVEDERGLAFVGRLDLESPEGKRAYEHLRAGRVHQMSIGFLAQETAWVKSDGDHYSHREIRKIKLFEVSLVTMAANQECEVDEVKALAAECKAGRALSAANEELLRTAADAIGKVLSSLDEPSGDDEEESDEDGSVDEADGADGKSADGRAEARAAEIAGLAEFFGGR